MPSVGTIVISLVILAVIGLAVRSVLKNRKAGRCAGCPSCGDGCSCGIPKPDK